MSCVFYVIANKAEKLHRPDQIEPSTKNFGSRSEEEKKKIAVRKKHHSSFSLIQFWPNAFLNNSVIVYCVALAFFRRYFYNSYLFDEWKKDENTKARAAGPNKRYLPSIDASYLFQYNRDTFLTLHTKDEEKVRY